jgi:hypothetical protein
MRFPLGIGLVEFSAGPSYIPSMGKRNISGRARRVATWQIGRLRGTLAALVGFVDAPDETTAKEQPSSNSSSGPKIN